MEEDTNKFLNRRIVFGMVGLPARGKSYISKKLTRFLVWTGYKAKVFNIGNYRRNQIGVDIDFNSFFDHTNKNCTKARDYCAKLALADLCNDINDDKINIAIFDGTNTTYLRRKLVKEFLEENLQVKYSLIWIESICDIDEIVQRNIIESKVNSPDYIDWEDKEKARQDFEQRIKAYEKVYEKVNADMEGEIKYIKIINQGKQMILNNISGYLESKLLSYLVNLHTGDRAIYFCRHGESEFNLKNLIGGDSNLSPQGVKFSQTLAKFFLNEFKNQNKKENINNEDLDDSNLLNKPKLFCSTLKRTIQTCKILQENTNFLFKDILSRKILDEIDCGLRDGMSYEDINQKYPDEFDERNKDKLNYRYPRGESYMDVIRRIEPMIYEIERSKSPIIIVGHQAMLRCLYGYFSNVGLEKIPHLNVPLHTVIKFVPKDYGFYEERFLMDIENNDYFEINYNQDFNDGKFLYLISYI